LPADDQQAVLFAEPAAKSESVPAPVANVKQTAGVPRAPKGPKPMDPALPGK
jgi:hypothetical protein